MVIDPTVLNMICLLHGKKRVRLHWRKGSSYWSESWDAHYVPDDIEKPPRLGYELSDITYEEHM